MQARLSFLISLQNQNARGQGCGPVRAFCGSRSSSRERVEAEGGEGRREADPKARSSRFEPSDPLSSSRPETSSRVSADDSLLNKRQGPQSS